MKKNISIISKPSNALVKISKMSINFGITRSQRIYGVALVALIGSSLSFAGPKNENPPTENLKFTCVKSRNIKLAELKEKLTSTCNLEKPFSVAASDTGVDSSYTFCCHTN